MQDKEAGVSAHSIDGGVGNMEYPHNPVNEGQPQGDKGINGAHGNAVQELL